MGIIYWKVCVDNDIIFTSLFEVALGRFYSTRLEIHVGMKSLLDIWYFDCRNRLVSYLP